MLIFFFACEYSFYNFLLLFGKRILIRIKIMFKCEVEFCVVAFVINDRRI